MRTGTRGAAGWSRVLSLAVLLFASPAFGLGGITDPQVDPRAANAIQSFKLDFSYESDLAFATARTTACAKMGIKCDAIQKGMIYYRTADNAIRYYDGAFWQTYAPAAGAGLTLDDVYTAGQSITRDLLPVTVTDGTVGATSTFVLNRTAGTGAVLDLSNAGTGNDITGDLWSVSTAGEIVAVGFTLGDDQSVNFGAATDAIILWDTTGTDHLEFSALTDSTEVHWDEDQHGLDQKWWGDTATAGDGMFFDASAVELSFLKTAAGAAAKLLLGYDDILSLGDSSEFTLKYDDDTTATYLVGVAGEELYVGADGTGMDVVIYSDTAGSSAQFTYASDSLVLTNYTIGMGDDDPIKFGASDDATIEWANVPGLLKIGAAGGTPVHFGVANAGLDVNLFDNGTAGVESLTWDAIDAVTNDSRLEFVHADAYFDDDSKIIMGTGATAAGDMTLNYTAANVLEVKQVVSGAGVDGTGEVKFGVDGEGVDVTFFGETSSDYMVWDQLVAGGTSALRFVSGPDLTGDADFVLTLGATNTVTPADGVKLTGGAGSMGVNGVAAGALVTFGGLADTDVRMTGAAGMVTFNAGDDEATFNGYDLTLEQEDMLVFGDGAANNGDVAIAFETSAAFPAADVLHIKPAAGAAAADQIVQFGTDGAANNVDVYFTSDSAGDGLRWNNSLSSLQFTDAVASFGDGANNSDAIIFGDDTDFSVYYDNADNALVFDPAGGGGNEINFGDEDDTNYPDILWHAGAASSLIFDDDADPGAPVLPAALYTSVVTNYDENSPLHFDVADQDTPADGFGISGNAGAAPDYLDIGSYAGAGTMRIGYISGAASDTDVDFYGTGANVSMEWNYGDDRLEFSNGGGSWFADNSIVSWGNTAAAPDAKMSWDATKLLLDTGGSADITVQMGTAAANHKVTTVFGDPATKGVTIDPNTATENGRIAYNTVNATSYLWLPASDFVAGTPNHNASAGAATDVYQGRLGSSKMGGWVMDVNDFADDEIDTVWTPPTWVQGGTDVTVKIVWASGKAEGACVLSWELCYLQLDVESAPGGRTNTNDALTCVETDFTYNAGSASYEINRTAAITIPHASVDRATSAGRFPIAITIKHDDDDDDETCTSDIQVLGLEMLVGRAYVD